jgi:hypothetical protein
VRLRPDEAAAAAALALAGLLTDAFAPNMLASLFMPAAALSSFFFASASADAPNSSSL